MEAFLWVKVTDAAKGVRFGEEPLEPNGPRKKRSKRPKRAESSSAAVACHNRLEGLPGKGTTGGVEPLPFAIFNIWGRRRLIAGDGI
jgi:hypothetical protein